MGEQVKDIISQVEGIRDLFNEKRKILRKIEALENKDLKVCIEEKYNTYHLNKYLNEKEIKNIILKNLLYQLKDKMAQIKSALNQNSEHTYNFIYKNIGKGDNNEYS